MYKINVIDLLRFELRSYFCRKVYKHKPALSKDSNYLNLGCGPNYIDGMVNADFLPTAKLWKIKQKLEWYLDLRYPLRCMDSVFDGIFMEHALEHLYHDDALRLLKELNRVMKNGATVRITVPDLEKYVAFYDGRMTGDEEKIFSKKFETGAAAIRRVSQDYFHQSLWDFKKLSRYLEDAGFVNIVKKSYRDCTDQMLCQDLEVRRWETLYVEAAKP